MAKEIVLTNPVEPGHLRAAYPRLLNAIGDEELLIWLPIEERALRSAFGVTDLKPATDQLLRDAMIAAWPAFQQQIRQVSSESTSTRGNSTTYAKGEQSFAFPAFIGGMLAGVIDDDASLAAPSTTELVR